MQYKVKKPTCRPRVKVLQLYMGLSRKGSFSKLDSQQYVYM